MYSSNSEIAPRIQACISHHLFYISTWMSYKNVKLNLFQNKFNDSSPIPHQTCVSLSPHGESFWIFTFLTPSTSNSEASLVYSTPKIQIKAVYCTDSILGQATTFSCLGDFSDLSPSTLCPFSPSYLPMIYLGIWARVSFLKCKSLLLPMNSHLTANKTILVFRTATSKCQKLGDLKQQKFIASQFWRWELWNQCISKAMFSLMALGENPSLALLAFVCQQNLTFLGLLMYQSSHMTAFFLCGFTLYFLHACLSLCLKFPFL